MHTAVNKLLWPLLLLGAAGLVYLLYRPALDAGFNFDDPPNLNGLLKLDGGTTEQKLDFVFGGTRHGGLGRPIALASFLLQAANWPSDPSSFLYTNILIHLLNGLLVAWWALRLHRLNPSLTASGEGFAVSLAAIWLAHPLLASSSLMVVQRMTTLATTFMLAGMIVYLMGRERQAQGNPRGWITMAAGLGFGTVLATLTKENGALLPLYVWITEITLIESYPSGRGIKIWRSLLALPAVLLVGYWLTHWSSLAAGMNTRPFTFHERLLTEPRVLAEYVSLIFIPIRSRFGPFHDDYALSTSLLDPPSTLACILGWSILVVIAIAGRKKHPLLAFAVGWFLVGHLLESTVFNLELYFEHRNYLPSLGPLALLCMGLWRLEPQDRKMGLAAFVLYFGLQAFVLHELTTVWGMPRLAAEMWVNEHPRSERARQQLGQKFILLKDDESALKTIRDGYRLNPSSTGLALQNLQMSCFRGDDIGREVDETIPNLRQGERSYAAVDSLQRLFNQLDGKHCKGLDHESLNRLLDALLANTKYKADPSALTEIYKLKAQLYLKQGNLDGVITNLETAFGLEPDIDVAMLTIGYMNSAGLHDAALAKIPEFRSHAPKNPMLNTSWNSRLDEAQEDTLAQLRAKSGHPDTHK